MGGGRGAAANRWRWRWLSSIYNTHNQKGKDKERLGLRGGRGRPMLRRSAAFVVRNRFFTAHFRRRMRRYNQIPPPDDLTADFDHSPVLPVG